MGSEELKRIVRCVVNKYRSIKKYEFEDLYFEGLIAALEAKEDYNPNLGVKISTHIYNRVKYKMIYLLRKVNAKKRNGGIEINYDLTLRESNTTYGDTYITYDEDFEIQLEQKETKNELVYFLKKNLEKNEYKIFKKYIDGYTVKEIAIFFNITQKQTSNKIYYIKNKIKKKRDRIKG